MKKPESADVHQAHVKILAFVIIGNLPVMALYRRRRPLRPTKHRRISLVRHHRAQNLDAYVAFEQYLTATVLLVSGGGIALCLNLFSGHRSWWIACSGMGFVLASGITLLNVVCRLWNLNLRYTNTRSHRWHTASSFLALMVATLLCFAGYGDSFEKPPESHHQDRVHDNHQQADTPEPAFICVMKEQSTPQYEPAQRR